jgi:hypothetical protein
MRKDHHIPFEEQFAKHRTIDPVSGCWLWTAGTEKGGYGKIKFRRRSMMVHRVSYEHFRGIIPAGMQLDHKCHNPEECKLGKKCPHRRCFNPAHLEPVTDAENRARGMSAKEKSIRAVAARTPKTGCPKGHPYTEYRGQKICVVCRRDATRRYRAKPV